MQLQHYIQLLQRRLWFLLLGIILGAGTTAAITFSKAPIYEASATIEVNAPDTDVFGNQALAVSYALQVTNDDVLQEVARDLPGVTIAQLQNVVSVSPIDGTQLISIRADVASPRQAATIANTVARVFIKQKLSSEIASQQAILDQLSSQLATAKTQMDQAQKQVDLLQQKNASDEQLQQAEAILINDQSIYQSLLTNYNSVQLQKAMLTGSLRINQQATLPTQPVGISKGLAIALAAVLSLILAILLVLLLDWIDVTIKTPEDVGHLAQLKALGNIPLLPQGLDLSPLLLGEEESDTLEQIFTIISTNFHAVYRGQRALLVTGLRHGSGISTTAARLAFDLAQSGLRVLLVDANLRQPSLHHAFQVVNTRGLANSLTDAMLIQEHPAKLGDWLSKWTTSVPNLWLWPSGPTSVSPLTVLRSVELRKVTTWLLQKPGKASGAIQESSPAIDIIVFDSPALLEDADVQTLALLCDSSILVINAAQERKETLQKAEILLERLGAPILGVVVNRQKATHRPYLYIRQPDQDNALGHSTGRAQGKYPLLVSPSFQPMTPATPALSTLSHEESLSSLDKKTPPFLSEKEGTGNGIPRRPFRRTLSQLEKLGEQEQ